jgi:xanthine/uracil permease
MAIGRLIEGFITILIGVNLIPSVADQVGITVNQSTDTNVTGSAASILSLVTLFFALGIMIAGVNIAVGGLQDVGLI